MPKLDTEDAGKPAEKAGRSRKYRPFPWRLWLFAALMTAGAVFAVRYAWQYRQDAKVATESGQSCADDLKKVQPKIDEATKKYEGCNALLDANNKKTQDQDRKTKEQEIQITALSNNLSASKDELTALVAQRAETEKRLAAIAEIQKQFAKMIDTGQLKVTARRGSLVLSLPSEVLFPSGIADLSEAGKLAALEVGFKLKAFPDRRFLVVGHTDDQPLKNTTYKDNWELSTTRALNVTRVLVQAGMDPKNVLAAGAGEHDPVSKDRAKNRRIEIALLPAISELPPLPASLAEDSKADAAKGLAEKPAEAPAPAPAAASPPAPAAPAPAGVSPAAPAKPEVARPAAPPASKP
jgi:chemotaxis protein MotB